MSEHDAAVRHFYETYGWQVGSSGNYRDAENFVDLRSVMGGYYRRRDRRMARQLAQPWRDLTDAMMHFDLDEIWDHAFKHWPDIDQAIADLAETARAHHQGAPTDLAADARSIRSPSGCA